jgi:hypothetical protein
MELLNSWLKVYYKIARSLGRNRFHRMVFMLRHQNNLDRNRTCAAYLSDLLGAYLSAFTIDCFS